MATSTQTGSKAHRSKGSRLRMPSPTGKPKSKGKDGPLPVGPAQTGRRAKPNPILLGGLGLVAVAALGRVAMPGLFGGGGGGKAVLSSFPAPLTNRHLAAHATATTVAGGTTATTAPSRPVRDPFTPPPGFGP